ncbi:MAG: hypothetical protein ACK4F4_07250 [Hylemonella sp.]|uniref:hypothetical protein n=1 Tax=Hylemonella sp. TaxID=2066020 RepID=UPI00391BB386
MARFKLTYIDQAGHAHRGTVPGGNIAGVIDQLERLYGEARVVACIRLPARPRLRLVPAHHLSGRPQCES